MKYLILILLLIGCATQTINEMDNQERIEHNQINQSASDISDDKVVPEPDNVDCELPYKYPPVNLTKTKLLVPFGLMTGSHVTPVDHQYFQDFSNEEPNIEVYSPADGIVQDIQHMRGSYEYEGNLETWSDYRLTIDHGCGIKSIYIHIDKLSDTLMQEAPTNAGYKSIRIPVTAGDIIGYYANNVDYNIWDENFELQGFVSPELYDREPWKIHVPNTIDYFVPEIGNKMMELCLSYSIDSCGKFDHDIEGTLQGNWFEEGTNGYEGNNPEAYWRTHVSFSPDYLDPTTFIISLGDYADAELQATAKGLKPKPAEVTPESGIIKYELVGYEYYSNGQVWDRQSLAKNINLKEATEDYGTVLVQMIEDKKIKLEVFPERDADEFTSAAKIYER